MSVLREIFNSDINVVYQYIAYVIDIPCRVFQALLVTVSASQNVCSKQMDKIYTQKSWNSGT
jgi:hypothetical protein